jgi:hypothetical protein
VEDREGDRREPARSEQDAECRGEPAHGEESSV